MNQPIQDQTNRLPAIIDLIIQKIDRDNLADMQIIQAKLEDWLKKREIQEKDVNWLSEENLKIEEIRRKCLRYLNQSLSEMPLKSPRIE